MGSVFRGRQDRNAHDNCGTRKTVVSDITVVQIRHSALGKPEWKRLSISRAILKRLLEVAAFEQGVEGQV